VVLFTRVGGLGEETMREAATQPERERRLQVKGGGGIVLEFLTSSVGGKEEKKKGVDTKLLISS